MRLSPPFVVRLTCDGVDEYLREAAPDRKPPLMTFPTMAEALTWADAARRLLGALPAVVPLAAVPDEER